MLLSINGADKISGQENDFLINLNPLFTDISYVELVYAFIPHNLNHPLYFIEIQGLNNPVISTLKNGSGRYTFVVPNEDITTDTVYYPSKTFKQEFAQIPNATMSNLRIRTYDEKGDPVVLLNDIQLILRID